MRGEIYISGEGLARGYLNNPSLIGEKFIFNPFAKDMGKFPAVCTGREIWENICPMEA
ncbi:hypothetical protein [Acetivibrio straminisolvens]|uniref:hypothetical protein n=1 Tax=Acetivibrio straminisolvens TaxID=253314 RepID=UPI001FB14B6C|nr:hypothetical protein [Acetivibrio straminisolvens]